MPKSAKIKDFHFQLFEYVSLCLCLVVLSLSMFCLSKYFDNAKNTTTVKVLGSQVDLEKERQFWTDTVKTTPTYRDGWIELAKIEDELGNHDLAEKYQVKAIQIDPNYFTEER